MGPAWQHATILGIRPAPEGPNFERVETTWTQATTGRTWKANAICSLCGNYDPNPVALRSHSNRRRWIVNSRSSSGRLFRQAVRRNEKSHSGRRFAVIEADQSVLPRVQGRCLTLVDLGISTSSLYPIGFDGIHSDSKILGWKELGGSFWKLSQPTSM